MKRKYFKQTFWLAACFVLSVCFTGCSNWTDTESMKINESNIQNQNPKLYAQYLTKLRAYKDSEHKIVISWFDNSNKLPINQAQHILALPDSLDYVSLMTPDTLTQSELDEIANVRENKATKFIFTIDFEAIKLIYDDRAKDFEAKKAKAEAEGKPFTLTYPDFNSFLIDSVKTTLKLVDKYHYDGINVAYNGKLKLYMSDEDKVTYTGYENDFLGITLDWHSRHTDKILFYQGKPQNMIDQSILSDCKYIMLPCTDAVSSAGLVYTTNCACVQGVPTDKFIPIVQTTSLDNSDVKTGYWSNSVHAISGAATWVAEEHSDFSITGLGIYNISTDYYHPAWTYNYVRTAITTINPSIKK